MNAKINLPDTAEFSLDFEVTGPLNEFVHLQLFDASGTLVHSAYQMLSQVLQKGIYQLHIFSDGQFEQKYIRLDTNYHMSWQNKGAYSVVDNRFLKSSRDYYSEQSRHWSGQVTVPESSVLIRDLAAHSSVFIFFRYPNKGVKEQQTDVAESMGWRFSLLDSFGKVKYRFNEETVQEDKEEGWLAFHASLAPGPYFLVYNGPQKREIPLYVFPGWQTQLLMMFKRTPIFQTTRIQLVRPDYDGNFIERDNLELDILMRNMQNGIHYLPDSLIRRMADNKWDNPMLAIAVCYAYFMGSDHQHDELFRTVVRNLHQKILLDEDAPDLKLIRLLEAKHFGRPLPLTELDEPCMLTAGMRAAIRFSIENAESFAISGLAEKIAESLMNDVEWTSYVPLDSHLVPNDSGLGPDLSLYKTHFSDLETIKFADTFEYLYSDYDSIADRTIPDLKKDWISQSLISQLSQEITGSIGLKELAYQFQVSPAMIAKRIRRLEILQKTDQQWSFSDPEVRPGSDHFRILSDNLLKILTSKSDNDLLGGSLGGFPLLPT